MKVSEARSLLSVDANCSQAALHDAWRRFVLQHHPDRQAHLSEAEIKSAESKTKRANLAYALLKTVPSERVSQTRKVRTGQAPSLDTFVRHAARQVSQAQDAVDTWSRHLARTRTGLVDGRRLLADGERFHLQFARLNDGVERLIESRRAAVMDSFERHSLSHVRSVILREPWRIEGQEATETIIEGLLPSDPLRLAEMLADIQSLHSQTRQQMASLQRRFEHMSNELSTLRKRLKTQHRTLRLGIAPFITAARTGRARVDAAQIAIAEALGLWTNLKETQDNRAILRSWRRQLTDIETDFLTLQARQLEADAAEVVYDTIMDNQRILRSEGRTQTDETMLLHDAVHSQLSLFWASKDTFPQESLGWLHTEIALLINKTAK